MILNLIKKYELMINILFKTFKEIPENSTIAIFGHGEIGIGIYRDIKNKRKDLKVLGFINSFSSSTIENIHVYSINELNNIKDSIDYVIIASVSDKTIKEIKKTLACNNFFNIVDIPVKKLKKYLQTKKRKKFNYKKIFLPTLKYLETHLTDHCNLNCKACSHYCNIAPECFANIDEFKINLLRLSKIFSNIETIRLMGGEPLLHPDINLFLKAARNLFPDSKIKLVTNGIMLQRMSTDFWQTCKQNGIMIDISKYPYTEKIFSKLVNMCEINDVKTEIINIGYEFYCFHNPNANSEPQKALNNCRKYFYCPILIGDRIYICAKSYFVKNYNQRFLKNIPVADGIDINSNSGSNILKYIETPVETCKYCSYEWKKIDWEVSKHEEDEWNFK